MNQNSAHKAQEPSENPTKSTPSAAAETEKSRPLAGTKTEKNLSTAAAEEAIAHTKYELYASGAYENGYATVGDALWDLSHQEREHSDIWYRLLGKTGTLEENLESAVAAETYAGDALYNEFARVAEEEGFDDIAETFRRVGKIEHNHRDIVKDLLTGLRDDTLYAGAPETARWFCTNCGYVAEGGAAPDHCPVCHYGKGYFFRYDEG